MINNKPKTIVVLGMHRSGTSMISGVLEKLQINMGEKLIEKKPPNPLGYFENRDFVDLNDKILYSAGGDWRNPPENKDILKQKDKFKTPIKMLVDNSESPIWGWKDPRTTLTIELFLPYISNPHFIVCHRDSESVANSLYKRDGTKFEKGIKLRKIYEERIESFFRSHTLPRLDVYYGKATSNSEECVEKIIDFLEIGPSDEQKNDAINFILPKQEIERLSNRLKITKMLEKSLEEPLFIPKYIIKRLKKEFNNKIN